VADSIAEALFKNKLINEHQMRVGLSIVSKKCQVMLKRPEVEAKGEVGPVQKPSATL
jgi:hypothetical protein